MNDAVSLQKVSSMSCWVVPAIAAELWGVTVERVLAGVRDGTVESRSEHGFVFVDVAPGSGVFVKPRKPGEPPPPTFVAVGREETDAAVTDREAAILTGKVKTRRGHVRMLELATAVLDDRELPPLDDEEDVTPLPPRQATRAAVARLRKPPPKALPATPIGPSTP